MRSYRLFLLPLLAGLTVLLTGALTVQTANFSPVTAPVPALPLKPDPAASAVLSQALAQLDRVLWIATGVWQKVDVPPLHFEAEGLYRAGPQHRLRLDMQIRSASSTSHLLTISDGRTLWQARHLAGCTPEITSMELGKVLAFLDEPGAAAQRLDFYQNEYFAGLVPLLETLEKEVTFTSLDRTKWRKRDVLLLAGARSMPAGDPWPDYVPRQCRLYFDPQSFWLHRLEWWGPVPEQTGDVLLSEMEFRSPVFNQPASDAEFAFQPGAIPVFDVTAQWTKVPSVP